MEYEVERERERIKDGRFTVKREPSRETKKERRAVACRAVVQPTRDGVISGRFNVA